MNYEISSLREFLRYLQIFADRCERSQKDFKDIKEDIHVCPLNFYDLPIQKSKRISQFSILCKECFDVLSGGVAYPGLVNMILDKPLDNYKDVIKMIHEYCVNEKCDKALKLTKLLIKNLEEDILSQERKVHTYDII
jgi:hypothetical protein